jgi:signal peptidase I
MGAGETAKPLGMVGTIARICRAPREFFRDFPELPTHVPSWLIYMLGTAGSFAGALAMNGQQFAATRILAGAALAAVFGIPKLYVTSACVQLAARLLKGKADFRSTRRVLGYGAAPSLFAIVPYVGVAFELWTAVVSILGLSRAHAVGKLRATGAFFLPTLVLAAFAIALRVLVVEAFRIPSASMAPALLPQDHVWVSKSAYGLISKALPRRGDLIVFEYPYARPGEDAQDFVKRAIAIEGDTLVIDKGQPFINDRPVPQCRVGSIASGELEPSSGAAELVLESLDGAVYLVLIEEGMRSLRQGPYQVPKGETYVLGDNRWNSSDSRAWNLGRGAGVPRDKIKGRANFVWFPFARWGALDGAPRIPAQFARPELQRELERCLERFRGAR